MTKRIRSTTVAMAVALLTMTTASAAGTEAGNFRSTSVESLRPFMALLTVDTTPLAQTDCTLTLAEDGTGRAIHLGAVAWGATETLDFCNKPHGFNATITGAFVMTAANGDELRGNYATLQRLDPETGQFTFAGLWSIEGGTGRFENTRGQGTLSGEGRLSAPPVRVTASMVGRLGY